MNVFSHVCAHFGICGRCGIILSQFWLRGQLQYRTALRLRYEKKKVVFLGWFWLRLRSRPCCDFLSSHFLLHILLWAILRPVTVQSQITQQYNRYVITHDASHGAGQNGPPFAPAQVNTVWIPISHGCEIGLIWAPPYTWRIECSWWGTYLAVPPLGLTHCLLFVFIYRYTWMHRTDMPGEWWV